MFDLLEEDLSKMAPEPPPRSSAVVEPKKTFEPTVYAMPEKFRLAQNKSSYVPLILGIVGLFAMLIIGTVIFLLVAKPVQPLTEAVDMPSDKNSQTLSTSTSQQESEIPTSTASTLELATSTLEVSSSSSPALSTIEISTSTRGVGRESNGPAQQPSSGPDADTDQLTDVEERLYGTDASKPDTDEDGFLDGSELTNGYDPLRKDGARLDGSSLVHEYVNQQHNFKVNYPSSWIADKVNQMNREILITSATGEFVSISIEDNPKKLGALEWGTTVLGQNNEEALLFQAETLSGINVAVSADRRVVILVKSDDAGSVTEPLVYTLRYNFNTQSVFSFDSTFAMMVKSFKFTEKKTDIPQR